ncbi:MAG: D-glycero-beta-D-manno-heptose 1-phosphate adenylyltransferase [Deltaproteobacteria bacterium]|nr:D-glycero-beta-D-manno-heptose 1-phosphate adenylyltransferase [Deltaproteobacteria bacterium]
MAKIVAWDELARRLQSLRSSGQKIVFTNGCFDLLHSGHVRYLAQAKSLGDVLVVGLNSDRSVRRLKGPGRPVRTQDRRCELLAALESVDFVVVFDQETPYRLIESIGPDVLVKGGDWPLAEIVGADLVQGRGGQVLSLSFTEGESTTSLIEQIKSLDRGPA